MEERDCESSAKGMVRHVPNALSIARIPLSVSLVVVKPFSTMFIVLYLLCGLTDLLDGPIARRYSVESQLGAKLDGMADFVFFFSSFSVIVTVFNIPGYLLVWAALIVVLRLSGLVMGMRKFHSWAALHTYANKAVFFAYYLFPLASGILGVELPGAMLCAITTYAFTEEIYINAHALTLDLDIPNARALK